MFSKIIERAKEDIKYNERILEGKNSEDIKATKHIDCDCVLPARINEMLKYKGFNIKEHYTRDVMKQSREYGDILEKYVLEKNDWVFSIEVQKDWTSVEEVYVVKELHNAKTGQEVKYQCSVENKSSNKTLDNLINFVEYSDENAYTKDIFFEELSLEDSLKSKGYNVVNEGLTFGLNKAKGRLVIDEYIYLEFASNVWDSLENSIFIEIKNNPHDDNYQFVNSLENLCYFFEYENSIDIKALDECIKAFKEHLKGNIGFYENNRYYNNLDIESFFENDMNNMILEADKRNNMVLIKRDFLDVREKEIQDKIVNKCKGIEMYAMYELTIGEDIDFSVNKKINNSVIEMRYDKSKDEDNCILTITNYSFYNKDEYMDVKYFEDMYSYYYEYKDKYMIDKVEIKGTYTELTAKIQEFVSLMISVY